MFDISYVTHSTLNPPKPILPNASCRNQRRPFTSADGAPELAPPNGVELAPPRSKESVDTDGKGDIKAPWPDAGPPLKRRRRRR